MEDKNTAVLEQDTMSLGDFMSAKPEEPAPVGEKLESFASFMGEPEQPESQFNVVRPIPEEHKDTFLLDMGLRLTEGINYGATNFNELLGHVTGLNKFDPYYKTFVQPGKDLHEQVAAITQPENLPSKISYDFASSLGNLSVTLPVDMMTGAASKTLLAAKMLPKIEMTLSALPDFVIGSGWRGLVEGMKDAKTPLEGVMGGLTRAGENAAFATLYAYSGTGLKGIASMTGLGVASTFYESAKSGRIPTKEEMAQGAAEGAAYGIIFSMIPMIREGTQLVKERNVLGEYQKEIDTHLTAGKTQDAMHVVDKILADERIRPEIKTAIDTVLIPKQPTKRQEFFEDIYQKVVNKFQSIENLSLRAKALGAEIPPGADPGLSAERYLSIGAQARNTLEQGTFRVTSEGNVIKTGEGLKTILDAYDTASPERNPNIRNKELNDFLISRRTLFDLQRPKAEGAEEFIATPEQTIAANRRVVELQEKFGNLSHLEQAAAQIYDYQKRVLRLLVDSGNISQETFDRIVEANPNYVPFDRVLPQEGFEGLSSKERFSGAKSPIKKIKGSELEIHDPIESIIKNTYRIMDAAARNKVWNDVYALREIPELGIKTVKTPMSKVAEVEGEPVFRPSQFKPKGNVLEGYVEGKRKYIEVSDNLFDAMTGLNEQSSSVMVKILSKPAQWLRIGATTTPEFVLRNPIRDQWTALIQTNLGWKPFVDSGAAIADIMGKSEVYNDWIRSGGSYAGFVELSRPRLNKMLDEIRGNKNILANLNIVTKLGDLSQLMEQGTRLGVFKAGLEKGLSQVEAAKQSREATVDFARRGSSTRDLNSTIAFFNAGIQGIDKTFRTIKDDPGGATVKALASITIPSTLLYLMNRNQPDYKELPRWQRDLFWMFKVNDIWFRIPKPFVYGQVFGSLPERFFEYLDSRDTSAFDKLGESLFNALSPVSDEPVSGLLPTAIKPLLENQTNYSFFRARAIVPYYKEKLLPSEQYSSYDTKTSKLLGKILNVSPSKIENLVQGWFGGMGRYGLQAGDVGIKFINALQGKEEQPGKPLELSDVPLVKGFVARTSGQSESIQSFYDTREKISQVYLTFKKFQKEGDRESALKLKAEHPEMALYKKFESAAGQISALSKKVDALSKKNISDNKKREMIKGFERKKIEIAKRALQASKEFSKE